MVVAWRRLDECDLSRPFGAWLRGIASRVVMAHYRKTKSRPVLVQENVLAVLDQQVESIVARSGDTWDEKVAAVHECLDALPDIHRDVVNVRYFDGMPVKLVAECFELSLETCKKRLQRARGMLSDCLKRKGVIIAGEVTS